MIELIVGGAVVLLASTGASYYLIQRLQEDLKNDYVGKIDHIGLDQDNKRKKLEEQVREQILHDIQSLGTKEGELQQGLQEASSTLSSLLEKKEAFKEKIANELKTELIGSLKDELKGELGEVSSRLAKLKSDEDVIDQKIDKEEKEFDKDITTVQERLLKIKDDEAQLMEKLEETAEHLSRMLDNKKNLEEGLKANLNKEVADQITQLGGQLTRLRNDATKERRHSKKDMDVAINEINLLRRAKDSLAESLRKDFATVVKTEKEELKTDIRDLQESRKNMKKDYDTEIKKLRADRQLLEAQIKKLSTSLKKVKR